MYMLDLRMKLSKLETQPFPFTGMTGEEGFITPTAGSGLGKDTVMVLS